MTRFALLSALVAIMPLWAADQPRFEEASVKADQCTLRNSIDPGRIAFRGDPLKAVLMEAFKVKMDDITGPSWLDTDCFTIIAKMPDGATGDQLPAMLQTLLAERFKLVAHKESHLRQGYDLIVDKNGPKFKESDPPPPGQNVAGGAHATPRGQAIVGIGRFGSNAASIKGSITMAALVSFLSKKLPGPVQDLTGLTGTYDIDLSWGKDPDSGPGDIFTVIRESLGLKLEPLKAPVDTLVIDHVDRVPTEN